MAAAGCDVLEDAQSLAVFGLIEPLTEIPRLLRLRRFLVERWTSDPPDVFVGIDAPDFNLGLERRLKERGVKVIHYVSPSVWAWRQGRIHKIDRAVDKVLCLLPFEKAFYDEHGIDAAFVGHPLADNTPTDLDGNAAKSSLGLDASRVLAVLPGSRMSEVSRLGPVFAATVALLRRRYPDLQFVAPMATGELRETFRRHLGDAGVVGVVTLTDGQAQTAIAASTLVLLASGTASLQAALLGKPVIAAYRLAALTYTIARAFRLVKVPYVSLPNLLTDKPLVPEFIQGDANPEALSTAVAALLDDPARRAAISSKFLALPGPSGTRRRRPRRRGGC